ncbi:uncharacterized protein LOC114428461 [Parambassis ranga]|uniref:Uncharacterized protein LOC114428461 n=1 Tax=Parambassis ranga TaxID=210632 RepID=A0A6P7HFD4_9TELE|nr:uncharacterized protein LOC114428461 [Parambassis ranga]
MEYKLIMAVSGFPSLYDTNSLTYRDLNMRGDAWRQVAEIVGVPESECRRKWKTLRDQHRRERQREKERRESGIGLHNYRPWRYSSILSFLNPFIDARAAGTNGWALDPHPSHVSELVGCSTTTDVTRSDDDESYGFAVADATTTSSSSSEFLHRKRQSSVSCDLIRAKEAKTEMNSGAAVTDEGMQPHANMKELFEMMMHSVTSLAASLASSQSSLLSSDQPQAAVPPAVAQPDPRARRSPLARLNQLKTEQQDGEVAQLLVQTDDDDDEGEEEEEEEENYHTVSPRLPRARRRSIDSLLEEFLKRMEAREAQRERDVEQRDDVTLFLLSLAPAMRRLTAQKQSWVRTKMQQFLHEAEFGATSF